MSAGTERRKSPDPYLYHGKYLGQYWEKDIASLRVFMATLRRKLEKNPQSLQYIQTHVGVGYRMMKFEESSENKKGEY